MPERFQIDVAYVPNEPDASFWQQARAYGLAYSLDIGGMPREGAEVRFAWNRQGLYVHAVLEDSFVVAMDRRNEQLHFKSGDVFELFVKPLDDDYYWEMYATPFGNRSTLFFPREREGMTVDDFLTRHAYHALEVSADMTSTGWQTQMFVPARQLTAAGAHWGAGTEWTVLCGRYNYNNEALEDPELSMLPPVLTTNYHLTAEYAVLKFEDQNG
jgi:hypothetical protein